MAIRGRYDIKFMKRFCRTCGLSFTGCCSLAVLLFVPLVVTSVLLAVCLSYVPALQAGIISALSSRDNATTIKLFAEIVVIVVIAGTIVALSNFITGYIALRMRRNLTRVLHWRYLDQPDMIYRINVMDKRIDNVDQRIQEDAGSAAAPGGGGGWRAFFCVMTRVHHRQKLCIPSVASPLID